MSRFVLLLCVCVTLMPYLVHAMTDEQKAMIHEHFETIGQMCLKDNPINEDDIGRLRSREVPSGPYVSCFLACIMKQTGIMDEHGMVQQETALDLARSVFNDEDELKIIEQYLHSCSYINSVTVGDGEKGCDRAALAYRCMLENAPQFGIDI